jgi:hypothetical protein
MTSFFPLRRSGWKLPKEKEDRLIVFVELERALHTRGRAKAAAVAKSPFDFDDLAFRYN